uniref:Uncharacterized protein n=1 Tax=Anguilla anguilla TaxID=7936 RepID=A0A0E9W651_ANGAN
MSTDRTPIASTDKRFFSVQFFGTQDFFCTPSYKYRQIFILSNRYKNRRRL